MLPDVVAQRRDPFHTVILYGGHLIGVLTEHPEHNRVGVLFSGPTGRRFRLPDADTTSSATASLIVAALSYHYQPHEIAVRDTGNGFVLWCPTCRGAGVPAGMGYTDERTALERAAVDHAAVSGHPATLVNHPQALPPDLAPDNAVATDERNIR
ncbi:hypothetical protein GCM10027597_09570 [Saccharopolyspora tripterygii]